MSSGLVASVFNSSPTTMKHADDRTLDKLTDLLVALRTIEGLKEKKRGIFYRKGQAFLHFHEDPGGLFADLRQADDWERFPVNTPDEQAQFLDRASFKTSTL